MEKEDNYLNIKISPQLTLKTLVQILSPKIKENMSYDLQLEFIDSQKKLFHLENSFINKFPEILEEVAKKKNKIEAAIILLLIAKEKESKLLETIFCDKKQVIQLVCINQNQGFEVKKN